MLKIKHFLIEDEVFNRKIYVVVGDPEKSRNHLKRKFKLSYEDCDSISKENDGCYFSVTNHKSQRKVFVIWVKNFRNTPGDIAVVAHEILHLTFAVMCYIGVKISDDSEEAFTYYMDSILKKVLLKLSKKSR